MDLLKKSFHQNSTAVSMNPTISCCQYFNKNLHGVDSHLNVDSCLFSTDNLLNRNPYDYDFSILVKYTVPVNIHTLLLASLVGQNFLQIKANENNALNEMEMNKVTRLASIPSEIG